MFPCFHPKEMTTGIPTIIITMLLNGEGDSINTSIGQKGAKSIDVEIFFLNKNNKSTGFFIFHVERLQKFRTSVRIPPVW